MKRGLIVIFCIMFLAGFALALPMTGSATAEATSQNQVQANVNASSTGDDNESKGVKVREQERVQAKELEDYQIRAIKRIQNRLHADADPANCPENCRCDGSTIKCELENGSREMTIHAGKSGNTIVQVKNANMSTRVALYRAQGKVYGEFNGNQTRELKVLPDEVVERLRERIRARLEAHNITLDENGTYRVEAKKRARLFWIVPVKEKMRLEMNSETGEITRTRTSWWGWMAKDVPEEDNSTEQ